MFPSTKPIQCLATEMLIFVKENLKRNFFPLAVWLTFLVIARVRNCKQIEKLHQYEKKSLERKT